MRTFRLLFSLLSAFVLVTGLFLYVNSDVEPVSWSPPAIPDLTGAYEVTSQSAFVNTFTIAMPADGPEDIAQGPDGYFYTGLVDGSIVRFSLERPDPEIVANTGGRPLGLQFDAVGNLIIADAYRGLLKLSSDGVTDVLVDQVNGAPMLLVDDLDIAADGTIWFSDASQRFDLHHFMKDILEASATGRLLSFTPSTGELVVHMSNLFFANGVALGLDDEFVLVNETGTGRIHRLWLKGDKKGSRDLFHDGLPGHPDNLSFNGSDTFWVALPAMRNAERDAAHDSLFVRKLLGGLPVEALTVKSQSGMVLGLNRQGDVTHMLYADPAAFTSITSVNQYADQLWLGSLTEERVQREPLPLARQ